MKAQSRALLWLVASALMFGAMAFTAKLASARLSGPQVAMIRFAVGLAPVVLIPRIRRTALNYQRLDLLLIRGFFGGLAVLFYFICIQHSSVGVATLLNYTAPIYSGLFSMLFIGERFSAKVLIPMPIALTGVCERVESVRVDRVQDARIRRLPFQMKIGSGLTKAQFARKVAEGTVRHVGLTESIAMIADAMGWTLDRITDEIQPKLATVTISSEYLAVDPGYVAGIIQDGIGYRKNEPVIKLHMEAYLGSPETFDSVDIEGSPNLSMKITGGIHGDVATASIAVNSIPKVLQASPGLHTMRDLPLPSFFSGR